MDKSEISGIEKIRQMLIEGVSESNILDEIMDAIIYSKLVPL